MKIVRINLAGVERPLCFSTRVVENCTERYGSINGIADAISGDDRAAAIRETLWILQQMLDAGTRYCKIIETDCPEPLDPEILPDIIGVNDLRDITPKIFETISESSGRTVETETSSKNPEATASS